MTSLDQFQAYIAQQASRFQVSPGIHPDDHIFNFVFTHTGFPSRELAIDYYFSDGAHSAQRFAGLLEAHLPDRTSYRVLEFASGYGCVTRHLVRRHSMDLWSCDIHPQALDFLQKEIGVRTLHSSRHPELVKFGSDFDSVFALSFFSHMPIATWCRWLVRLFAAVRPGGLLIFTTHGENSRKHFGEPVIPEMGFWFRSESEQQDLSPDEYGQTIVSAAFVKRNLASIAFAELVEYREGYWWEHQDLYIVRKDL